MDGAAAGSKRKRAETAEPDVPPDPAVPVADAAVCGTAVANQESPDCAKAKAAVPAQESSFPEALQVCRTIMHQNGNNSAFLHMSVHPHECFERTAVCRTCLDGCWMRWSWMSPHVSLGYVSMPLPHSAVQAGLCGAH